MLIEVYEDKSDISIRHEDGIFVSIRLLTLKLCIFVFFHRMKNIIKWA